MAETNTNNSSNVFYGKPKATGAVFRAPANTALPTDATTALAAAFKPMGYISQDGLTESESRTVEKLAAWGGDTVATSQTEYSKTFKFACLENNENVLKARFGEDNVTVASGKVTVNHTSAELEEGVWVFEIALGASKVKRMVLPKAKPTEFDDITYQDSTAIMYGMTLECLPADGKYVIEYEGAVA